jgi:hypothetical protein
MESTAKHKKILKEKAPIEYWDYENDKVTNSVEII